jgi:Ca-activated chloride channel family protein
MSKTAERLVLVVVSLAIIAILAAIATPNFLESSTRAQQSRAFYAARVRGYQLRDGIPAPPDGAQMQLYRVKGGEGAPPTWATFVAADIDPSRERYSRIDTNPFKLATVAPLSTFSIDVDTAAYSNVRRMLNEGSVVPKDAVRIEEMVNYFPYNYPQPAGEVPFSLNVETGPCPWELDHRLVRVGIKGREISVANRPAANLVFLLDVSGSMSDANKLPLVKQSLELLTKTLKANDRVSIVVYAGASGLVLPPTAGNNEAAILRAMDSLNSGGSTNGGAGIQLAYKTAKENFIKDGINRVILCTDGDFNVGTTGDGDLTRLVEEEAKSGVYITVLGFGGGNLNDSMMEQITNRGNGNYAYIDTLAEAKKALVEQASGTLLTIAKDVKIQVEFNPTQVQAYRLVGYENRLMANEDFNDDKKDAGEIGAGHTVTAFYEIIPAGVELGVKLPTVDPLKYQSETAADGQSDEMLTVKVRYKQPDSDTSDKIELAVRDDGRSLDACSDDFVFAACVASFGLVLRGDQGVELLSTELLGELAESARQNDPNSYRKEFIELVDAYDKRVAAAK